MLRNCSHCRRAFTPHDLVRTVSRGLEADRKAAGLDGVRFLYYACPGCGQDDIFVDILPRDGEFVEDYEARRAAMEAAVRALPAGPVDAVVVPVKQPDAGALA
jgi:hypothetical protein